LSSLTRSLVMLRKQSGPVVEVPASSNVWSLLDLVPAQREAHTAGVIKIIFLAGDSSYQPEFSINTRRRRIAAMDRVIRTGDGRVEVGGYREWLAGGYFRDWPPQQIIESGKRSTSRKPSCAVDLKAAVPGLPPTASNSS
jgi:hypothetical protein